MNITATLLFLTLTLTITAQEFPKDLFEEGHNYAASVQFGDPPTDKVDHKSEAWEMIKGYVTEDLKAMGMEPKVIYLRSTGGAGGIAPKMKEEHVRCLLSFTFYSYSKKGGDRDSYSGGQLDITEVDEEGKKTSKSIRFTIGGKGGDKMSYNELLGKLKDYLGKE